MDEKAVVFLSRKSFISPFAQIKRN